MPGPVYFLLGLATTLCLTLLLGGTYLLIYAKHRHAALLIARAAPAVVSVLWAWAIVVVIDGNDGWGLAGLLVPLIFALTSPKRSWTAARPSPAASCAATAPSREPPIPRKRIRRNP